MDNGWQHFWILLRILWRNGIIHLIEKVNTGFDILNISMNYATIIFSHVNFLLILPALIQNAYLIKLGGILHLETITFDIWNNDGTYMTFNWRQTLESDCKFLLYNTWVLLNSSSYIDIEVFISVWCSFSSIHLLSTHCTVQYQIWIPKHNSLWSSGRNAQRIVLSSAIRLALIGMANKCKVSWISQSH